MKKIMRYVLIAVLVIIFIVAFVLLSDPLRQSDKRIKADMLRITPVGTSIEDVIAIIENNDNWQIEHTWDRGYSLKYGYPTGSHQDFIKHDDASIVGVKGMEVYIGSYNFLFFILEERVSIYYGFAEDSTLVDLAVRKDAMDII